MFTRNHLSLKGLGLALTVLLIVLFSASYTEAARDEAAEAIWTYDSDLNVNHIETADLNDDKIPDIIAGEYSSDYYGSLSKIIAIDGYTGDTLWTYQLNDGARSMAIGDINNDGVADVIAGASYNSSDTPDGHVHAINGIDGSQLWTFYIGATISDVTVCNLNGDQYLDVAAGSFDDYIYAINGETGAELWHRLIGSMWVNVVAAGDVNDDGIDDIAYAHEYLAGYDNYMGVLDGTDGTPIWDSTVAYVVLDVLIEDIDNDGDPEAVFSGIYSDDHGEIFIRDAATGILEWGYNLGSINHTNGNIFLFAEDIDEDTDQDLLVGNYLGFMNLLVFEGDSDIPIWTSELLDGYPRDVAVGDVTGNGNINIVTATYDRVQVLEAADGTKVWPYSVAGTIKKVDIGDFDDDGILDVAAGGAAEMSGWPPDPGKTVWALRTVQSPLLWKHNFGEYGNDLAVDNLNGDEFMDAVAVCSVDDMAIAINGETGEELWTWVGTENLYAVTSGDFNNDGFSDVAVAGYDETVTALSGNNGSVMWQFTTPTDQIYRKCLAAADLNDDENIDVIAGAEDNYVYAINGLTGVALWSCNAEGEVTDVTLAQMNGVGPIDVVAGVGGGPNGEKVIVIDGSDGSVLWDYPAPASVEHVTVCDVTDDGVPDVAAAVTPYAPRQIIMINGFDQTQIWTSPVEAGSNTQSLANGDVDGDKTPDIIVPGNSTNKKVYALSGLDGLEIMSYETGGEVNCVLAYDIDNDDEVEVIAGSDDQNIYVLNSNGDIEWNYSAEDDVMQIKIGDIGGDSRPYMACVTFGSDGLVYAFKSLAPEITYMCGDVNDDDVVDLLDILFLIQYKYKDGPAPDPMESADVNSDTNVDLLDILYLIQYKYKDGPEPYCP